MPRQPNPQNRLACDRCHAQKLRCQRQEGQGFCVRCARSDAKCVFSPRQRRAANAAPPSKSSESSPAAASQTAGVTARGDNEENNDVEFHLDLFDQDIMSGQFLSPFSHIPTSMDYTWPALLGSGVPSGSSPGLLSCHNPADSSARSNCSPSREFVSSESQEVAQPGEADDIVGVEPAPNGPSSITTLDTEATQSMDVHYVRQLADLNVQLYEHAETLPPLSMATRDRTPTLDGRMFAIDKTFGMTQTLIDVINRLYPRAGTSSEFVPDQGTVLLLLSCANRVFDIYEVIFGHMRGCIQHQLTPVTADGKTLVLPQLRIGTFAPPTPAAIAMHMLMVVMMASSLFDQLQEALGVWRGDASDHRWGSRGRTELELAFGTASHVPDFTDEARSEVSRRASVVAGEILSTRQLLLGMSGSQTVGSMTKTMST